MRKRERGREEKLSLPLAVAAASLRCRSPSQPLAVSAARLRCRSHLCHRRCCSHLRHRRCCSPSSRIVLAVAASPSLSVAVDRHQSHLSPSRSIASVWSLNLKMENINYADFLIKRRSSWIKKSTTNLYCNLNGLQDIVKVLQKVGELQELRKICFGHLLGFPKELTFSAGVLHNLLLRQIHVPGVTGANELHFLVGGKLAKFSQREFCLVTGLKFGVMSDIFLKPYAATKDGIHVRCFANNENIRLTDIWARFMAGGFDQPKDGLKMALIWAMEAFGSLIDLVGKNLGHRHPRLKNWRIFKRPYDFFGKLAKYEKEVADGKVRFLFPLQEDYVEGPNVGGEGTVGKRVGEGDANRTEAFDEGDGNVGKGVGEGDATLTEELDGGDGTVGKGVSRGDNDQGGPDSTLGGGDVVQSHPPSEDDSTMVDYLAVKNEREQRLKITSRYMNSPYIDPFQAPDKEKQKLKTDYSRFKRSRKDAALNVGTDYYATKQFFVEMESPTCWLSNEAKLCEEWKKFQPYEDASLTGEFDALSYKCPTYWLLYASGDNPGWGTCWSSVRYLLVPCAVGDPDGHWILCVIDLEKRTVCIYDPLHRQKKIPTRRKQITPLLRFIPVILQESGYYQQKGIQPNRSMFTVQQSIPKKLPAQMDNDSCGVFICRYTDMLMRHKCFWGWGTKNVPGFREEMALEIFANSVASD
ncbi:hypothetical protein Dsin_024618 [Dipteronia sinensis]|uniref:Ubiquitin-like protease family profile domain-containing protein n=1 Tax=Dipteronia sinensis TaxID=43782 RepID=A0AAE0DWE4_9ROSI|nr:hypothetical protein Dsin_024618 [Dipteronia sinensis]